jgi:AraC-like DNA-binding protein
MKTTKSEVKTMAIGILFSPKAWRIAGPRNSNLYLAFARKSRFKVQKMAQLLGISQRQLQRDTQRFFGLKPRHWIKQQRLTAARNLLEEYGSVQRVSMRLGFKRLSHFSREFKLFHGVSPRQYLNRSLKRRFIAKVKAAASKAEFRG